MRKLLTALVAVVAIGATTVAMSTPAAAWRGGWGWGWRGGWGWGPGPFVAGAVVGAAVAAPYYYGYYYPYGPYYGGYGGYGCRRFWNGYYWARSC
jgi:hypothetical protein